MLLKGWKKLAQGVEDVFFGENLCCCLGLARALRMIDIVLANFLKGSLEGDVFVGCPPFVGVAEVGKVEFVRGCVFEAGAPAFDRVFAAIFDRFGIFKAVGVADINEAAISFSEKAFDVDAGVFLLGDVMGG